MRTQIQKNDIFLTFALSTLMSILNTMPEKKKTFKA